MSSQRCRTSFIYCVSPCVRSQALTEVDKTQSVSGPTWCSSRRRHLRALRKKDAELTDGSAPIIFYTIEKVNARAEPAAAAQSIPRSRHSPRVVPFVQLFVALGSPKRCNPMAPTHQTWTYRRVRFALVMLPPLPVPTRAGVGSREREARFRSLAVGRWVAVAPGTESCQHGRAFACLELFDGSYVLSEYRLRGMHTTCTIGKRGSVRTIHL